MKQPIIKIINVILFAMLPSLAFADEAQRYLAVGDSLYAQRQYDAAVEQYVLAASKGLAEAQFNLGYAYYEGEGTKRNYADAAMWFKRAAAQDFAKAEYNLAYCYMNGRGVPRDYDKALSFLTKSAKHGYKQACITLSDCYANGVLVEKDETESKFWLNYKAGQSAALPEPVQTPASEPTLVATPVTEPEIVQASVPEVAQVPESVVAQEQTPVVAAQQESSTPVFDITLDGPLTLRNGESADAHTQVSSNPVASASVPSNPVASAANAVVSSSGAIIKVATEDRKPIVVSRQGVQSSKTTTQPTLQPIAESVAEQPETVQVAQQPVKMNVPPVIKILYPENNSLFHTDLVKIKYQLQTFGNDSTTIITLMVDGEKVPATKSVHQPNIIEVPLPNRDCTVTLFAQNANGNSEPSTIRLVRENVNALEIPRLFAVVVGVGKYDNPSFPNLRLTCKDAADFASVLSSKLDKPFSDVQVKLLCDEEASRADIYEALEWMSQEASPYDLCIFYFSGHGYKNEHDQFYFVPFHGDANKIYNCFSAYDFRNLADNINSKLIIFVDACYSGGLMDGTKSAATESFVNQLRRVKNGMLLYASSSSDTKSNEDPSWGNGAYTKALVEAFNGATRRPTDDGLSTQQLEMYLYNEVRKTTNCRQSPVLINPSGLEHFNIFIYEK